jgi:hypothetical protein
LAFFFPFRHALILTTSFRPVETIFLRIPR